MDDEFRASLESLSPAALVDLDRELLVKSLDRYARLDDQFQAQQQRQVLAEFMASQSESTIDSSGYTILQMPDDPSEDMQRAVKLEEQRQLVADLEAQQANGEDVADQLKGATEYLASLVA